MFHSGQFISYTVAVRSLTGGFYTVPVSLEISSGQPRPTEETAARERTRSAILAAAVNVLATKPTASLGDIAAAARVGRTTLHRYFAERQELVDEIGRLAARSRREAAERARLDEGTGLDAVARLCREYYELADLLAVMFSTPGVLEVADTCIGDEDDVNAAIERGHRDGSIRPDLTVDWVQNLVWTFLYTAVDYVARGQGTRMEVLRLTVESLRGAIGTFGTRDTPPHR
ncbi:TetR/AcrR family transcriptional regulator [Rhodococcus triatomae]|nr:TetR/AcrR family transcriptional regulator [Rhodococcus triatomae]QNG24874.1 TetR/AcrR family transcriptional regulator [Rhodococcus triatomae]